MQTNRIHPLILIALLVISSIIGSFGGSYYTERRLTEYYDPMFQRHERELASYESTLWQLNVTNIELREDVETLQEYLKYYEDLSEKLENSTDPVSIFDPVMSHGFEYIPTHLSYDAEAAQYSLPLNVANIDNFQEVNTQLGLSGQAKTMLRKNGFVVLENSVIGEEEYVTKYYRELKKLDIPLFITSDSILHMYHIQFDETLKNIEQKIFYADIWNISIALYSHSISQMDSNEGKLQEAYRRNAEYFAVALCLLKPELDQISDPPGRHDRPDEGAFYEEDIEKYSFTFDPRIADTVEKELGYIKERAGINFSNIFIYEEDYSQYAPRGHYTRSEKLKNYFKAFMWFGRMSLLLKGDSNTQPGKVCQVFPPCEALISEYDAEIMTLQACLITGYMQQWYHLWQRWSRIYDITSFYVGISDDLGPIEYLEALNTVFSGEYLPEEINSEKIKEIEQFLLQYPKPKIYGGTGNVLLSLPIKPEQLDAVLEATTGFRLMGQRSVPDSCMFQELVIPRVHSPLGPEEPFTLVHTIAGPTRGFPRGLDVMGILGSNRAKEVLDELKDSNYENYQEQFDMLVEEYEGYSDQEWNKDLYWSWLYTLKPLLKEYPAGYPTFMQTEAWQDKQLTTALASWTELRHDTLLYVKQSYSMVPTSGTAAMKPVQGYVEPVPEFWARLLDLTKMTGRGLDSYGVLDEESENRIKSLENIITRLLDISEKELINEALSENDYWFITNFADELDDVVSNLEKDSKRVTLVADVHTEPNTLQVLEEGIGYLRLMIVAYKLPDGRIGVGAGPVLSYYEFKHPIEDRLTDEAWRDLLDESPPDNPEWIDSFTDTT